MQEAEEEEEEDKDGEKSASRYRDRCAYSLLLEEGPIGPNWGNLSNIVDHLPTNNNVRPHR